MLQSFAPLIDKNTRFLIIGTMPGTASLQVQEYYAFKHNQFWKIMADIFNEGCLLADYEQKCRCLLRHNVGLWDNLQYCEREGSLDSNIKNAQPNDFETLLQEYPKVKKIFFNGQKSKGFFMKFHPKLAAGKECAVLPSTSPANAMINYAQKLDLWRKALVCG